MLQFKKKIAVEQKRVSALQIAFFIFNLRRDYADLKDHSLIAHLLKTRFKLNVSKQDIDDYYGFNDIITECFEDESRKHFYTLQCQ